MKSKEVTFECADDGEPLSGFFVPDESGNVSVVIDPCPECKRRNLEK